MSRRGEECGGEWEPHLCQCGLRLWQDAQQLGGLSVSIIRWCAGMEWYVLMLVCNCLSGLEVRKGLRIQNLPENKH